MLVIEDKSAPESLKSTPVNPRLEKNLATYLATASAAGVSMLAMTPQASAKVIYTPAHLNFATNIYIDVNHDGVTDIGIRASGGCALEELGSICGEGNNIGASSYTVAKFLGGRSSFTPALFVGAKISPSAQFNAMAVIGSNFYVLHSGTVLPPNWFGPFANGGKGVRDRYIGFKFNIGSQPHYGWLRVSVQITNPQQHGYTAFITGYAYETEANQGITAGQTTGAEIMPAAAAPNSPSAASLGMLARGADALAIWRRQDEAVSQ